MNNLPPNLYNKKSRPKNLSLFSSQTFPYNTNSILKQKFPLLQIKDFPDKIIGFLLLNLQLKSYSQI
jgi:hypothetical protein